MHKKSMKYVQEIIKLSTEAAKDADSDQALTLATAALNCAKALDVLHIIDRTS